jgi:hypothetical protein
MQLLPISKQKLTAAELLSIKAKFFITYKNSEINLSLDFLT